MKYKVIFAITGNDPTPQGSFTFYTFNSALLACTKWLETATNARAYFYDGTEWRIYAN